MFSERGYTHPEGEPTHRTYYDVLGISPRASESEVRRAFKRLSLQHHPDVGGNTQAFQLISEAYTVLKDPVMRMAYNKGQGVEEMWSGAEVNDVVRTRLMKSTLPDELRDRLMTMDASLRRAVITDDELLSLDDDELVKVFGWRRRPSRGDDFWTRFNSAP